MTRPCESLIVLRTFDHTLLQWRTQTSSKREKISWPVVTRTYINMSLFLWSKFEKNRWKDQRASVDGYTSACCDLDLWLFDLISMSRAQVHTWKILAKLAQIFTKILYAPGILCSLLAVTLTFDLWSQNLISTSTNPNTSVTKIGWNAPHWFLRYGVHKVFATHRLTHSLTHDGQIRVVYCI